MTSSPLRALGVDLVEIQKARAFYERHKRRLPSFFSREEILFIRRGGKTAENLAVLLAAKEAVFKALPGRALFGPDGFRQIRILPERGKKLSFRLGAGFAAAGSAGLRLSAERNNRYVTVTCAGTC